MVKLTEAEREVLARDAGEHEDGGISHGVQRFGYAR